MLRFVFSFAMHERFKCLPCILIRIVRCSNTLSEGVQSLIARHMFVVLT